MDTFQNITDMFLSNAHNHRPTVKAVAGHMKKYTTAYEQGTYLMMEFEKVDSVTGDLSLVDEDITVIMPADQISGRPYDLRYRAQKLEDTYCVKVLSVDSARKIVYVSHQEARMEKRPEIEATIQQYLDTQTPIIVKGKVLKIQTRMSDGDFVDTGVWLDLCGVGIPAFVYIGNWKKTYTETLRGKVQYGDIIDVKVIERVERKNGMYYYACSRKELVQDPWESQELAEKYHKGDIVKIRCISRRENNWFGEINGLDDIQVFVEYPSERHQFAIIPGMEYMGTIYYINQEERSLKARVFQALSLEQLDEENESAGISEENVADEEREIENNTEELEQEAEAAEVEDGNND